LFITPSLFHFSDVDVRRDQLLDLAKPELLGPHPLPRDRPGAARLDAEVPLVARAVVVARRRDAEEAVLAPRAAPRVAHDPVLDGLAKLVRLAVGVLDAPAHDGDKVVDLRRFDVLFEDPKGAERERERARARKGQREKREKGE